MATTMELQGGKILVVDDSKTEALVTAELLTDAGFQPKVIEPPFGALHELLERVRVEQPVGVICDHRLRSSFKGAEAVAALYKEDKLPALLVTQYVDQDAEYDIRRYRQWIPILMNREEVDPETILIGLRVCAKEIREGVIPEERLSWRSLVEIDDVRDGLLDVIIPGWNPRHAVTIPKTLVPESLSEHLHPGGYLFAMVNVGAERQEDLWFSDFEAPEEGDDDGC